jgi:hypothetical protein
VGFRPRGDSEGDLEKFSLEEEGDIALRISLDHLEMFSSRSELSLLQEGEDAKVLPLSRGKIGATLSDSLRLLSCKSSYRWVWETS